MAARARAWRSSFDADLPTSTTYAGAAAGQFDYTYDAALRLSAREAHERRRRASTAVARDDDGLVTGFGPFTFERTGPGGVVSADRRRRARADARPTTAAGASARARSPSRASRLRRGAHARRRRADHAQGRDRRRRGDDLRLRLRRRRPAAEVDRDGVPVERYTYDANGNRTSRRLGRRARPRRSPTTARTGSTTRGGVDVRLRRRRLPGAARHATRSPTARAASCWSATVGATTVTYAYDGLGRRVARTQGGDTTAVPLRQPGRPVPGDRRARAVRRADVLLLRRGRAAVRAGARRRAATTSPPTRSAPRAW